LYTTMVMLSIQFIGTLLAPWAAMTSGAGIHSLFVSRHQRRRHHGERSRAPGAERPVRLGRRHDDRHRLLAQ
jgi:hypothetical protein